MVRGVARQGVAAAGIRLRPLSWQILRIGNRSRRPSKKPRVETREHDARKPAASCRGSLGGPPPAWNQPGPPGLARTREAPGGNPGTPGMKTTVPSMPDDGKHLPGSNPQRMAPAKACHPESPGSRRGLLVPFARVKPRARLGNAHHQKARAEGMRMAAREATRIPSSDDSGFPATGHDGRCLEARGASRGNADGRMGSDADSLI